MNQRMVLRGIFAFGLGLLLSAGAQAQAFRTYLSASGNDSNPCSLVAPCRLLPAAIAAVIDGGEVWMLDSANYNTGPVNVNKSVTILAVPGALGSVVALGGNAIDITTANVNVALRNLVIVPYVGGGGSHGIRMYAVASLTVQDCLIANLPGIGITVATNGASASVLVMDSVIRGNATGLLVQEGPRATVTRAVISGNGSHGVYLHGGTAGRTTTAVIADSTIDANGLGVYAVSTTARALVIVSVRDSQVVRNSASGLYAGGDTTLSASNNIISNNDSGIVAYSSRAKVWASGNTVSDNVTGLSNYVDFPGLFESAGDNAVRNNGTNATGAISVVPKF